MEAISIKTVGIVAEYNPFHNGHAYHIRKARELTGADTVVCVMSGNFVQRGDVAIADKWVRTRMALAGGADLVLELPCYFALNNAQVFAYGATATLDALGCVDALCFGGETDNLEKIIQIAKLMDNETAELSEEINKRLQDGEGYPAARAGSIEKIHGIDAEILSSPNNILAIEYIRSLKNLKTDMTPYVVLRHKADYHSVEPTDDIASATAMRHRIKMGQDIKEYMPKEVFEIYCNSLESGITPVFSEYFDKAVISKLRSSNAKDLEGINHMGEGLHNRIKQMSSGCYSIETLVREVSTKRYTNARAARAIWSAFLDIRAGMYSDNPTYIRVLGMNDMGRVLLAKAKHTAKLPVITKLADFDDRYDRLLQLDILSMDLYTMGYPKSENRVGGMDYMTSPIVWRL